MYLGHCARSFNEQTSASSAAKGPPYPLAQFNTQIYIQTTFVCNTKCEIAVITYLIRPMPEGLLLLRFSGIASQGSNETAHNVAIINSFVIWPTSINFMARFTLLQESRQKGPTKFLITSLLLQTNNISFDMPQRFKYKQLEQKKNFYLIQRELKLHQRDARCYLFYFRKLYLILSIFHPNFSKLLISLLSFISFERDKFPFLAISF